MAVSSAHMQVLLSRMLRAWEAAIALRAEARALREDVLACRTCAILHSSSAPGTPPVASSGFTLRGVSVLARLANLNHD